MRKMRLAAMILAATMVVPVAASAEEEPLKVGFIQLVDMADAVQMHDAFIETIEESGKNIEVDFQDAAGDQPTMATIRTVGPGRCPWPRRRPARTSR